MTQVTISGETFEIADKYVEGAALTANEASALNQLRRENIRNNQAKFVAGLKEAGTFDLASAQSTIDTYATSYEFGQRTGGGGGGGDPIEREAVDMARETIKLKLRSAGKKLADYTAVQITGAAKKLVDSDPSFRKEAAKRVKALQSNTVSDDILAGLDTPETEEAAAA